MGAYLSNYDFLRLYQELQLGIVFDELFNLDFAVVSYSKTNDSYYWNGSLTNQPLNDAQIVLVEKKFSSLHRRPSFYFEDLPGMSKFASKLKSKNYTKEYVDNWLFWDGGEISNRHFDTVKKVADKKELDVFLRTFDKCYQADDPQNPYGEQSGYLPSAKVPWLENNASGKVEYFIVYDGKEVVAVSSLTNLNGIGYISNVGSLRSVRGQGYGKAATLYCVNTSINHGNNLHCLATEEGHYPNDFYSRNGFSCRFKAVGYVKSYT